MKPSPLQLETFFVTRSSIDAILTERPMSEAPLQINIEVFLDSETDFGVVAEISWGKDNESAYAVEVKAHARFTYPEIECNRDDEDSLTFKRARLGGYFHNASAIVIGSVREYIANLTARGPHSDAILPMTIVGNDDLEIHVHESMNYVLPADEVKSTQKARKSSRKKPPNRPRPSTT